MQLRNKESNGIGLPESTFALIIGGGPVGTTVALSLAQYGYECVVLERHAERLGQPKAHVLSPRTLEIFRQLKVDLTPLREVGLQPHEADAVRFVSSMTGVEFGVIDWTQDEDNWASPERLFNVAQPFLEDHLLKAALKTGKIKYLRKHEWKTCVEEPGKIIASHVWSHELGTSEVIRSKFVIGCDGVKARSREEFQISFDPLDGGVERVLHYASIHFSADLRHLKPGTLWFVMNPKGMGVFIAYSRKNSWVYFVPYDPVKTPRETLTSEYLKALVFEAVGKPLADYKELGITLWTTSPKLARTYRSPKFSNAFLAGDAAHSFPPTGGLGVNTGIADVQNLIWKIHAVEQGWASEALLDTVSSERIPIAKENCLQSKINEDTIFRLINAALRPGKTAEEVMADPTLRKHIQDAIAENYDHFHSLNLQLGYVYGRNLTRRPSDYKKELYPGARLPHVWLEAGGRKISSLDLIDGFGFVLLASPRFPTLDDYIDHGVPVSVKQLNRNFVDVNGEWQALFAEWEREGYGVLVRPDQHIVGIVQKVEEVSAQLHRFLKQSP